MFRPFASIATILVVVALVAALGPPPWRAQPAVEAVAAPDIQISAKDFGDYVRQWSEPEGFFDSDNFIGNETSYLHIINELRQRVQPGGVYLGVGPDQNFSYIAATKPSLAIILDIRRQNMLEHLLYKALFEMASTRGEYLSLLFSRESPKIARDASLPALLKAVRAAPSPRSQYEKNLSAVKDLLTRRWPDMLSADDLSKIEYVYETFWREGLDLRFSTIGRANAFQYPTYESLLLDTDVAGKRHNYLDSDESFQWLKKFEAENRLIAIVGDFAGNYAFNQVTSFLNAKHLQVSTFYTSNVEFYLFGRPAWDQYMDNVMKIPSSRNAVFIRAYFSTYGREHPQNVPGHRSTTLVHDFNKFVADYKAARIPTYWEVVNR